MFREGTLVSTNQGIIPIEKFGFARRYSEKSECKPNLMLKTYEGDWNKCIYQTYKRSSGIKIKFETGFSIDCTPSQLILTPDGLKKVEDIKIGDEVCYYSDSYVNKTTSFSEIEQIRYIPQPNNDIYIPKKMTEELATLCGILVNPTTVIRVNDDKMVIVCKDRIINKIIIRYIRDLFQTKQRVVVQDDQYCRIFSPYIIDFLDKVCGLNHKTQKLDQSMMQARRDIHICFLNALLMSEKENSKGTLNFTYVYKMDSPYISDQIEAILELYGYRPFVKQILKQKTICIRKEVDKFFDDKMLDKMKKESRQIITTVKTIRKSSKGNYFGIICEKDNYAIKNLVFGVSSE